jgi:transposase
LPTRPTTPTPSATTSSAAASNLSFRRKSNRKATIRYDKSPYRQRNCVERVFGHLKSNRAVASRYDQLADSFLGMLFIASARSLIKFVHAA